MALYNDVTLYNNDMAALDDAHGNDDLAALDVARSNNDMDAFDDAVDVMHAIANEELPANFFVTSAITDGAMDDCHVDEIVAV